MVNKYTKSELIKFLSLANKKLKKVRKNLKNVRIERNRYKKKLEEIESMVSGGSKHFDGAWDDYYGSADREYERWCGKKELKEEIFEILKK